MALPPLAAGGVHVTVANAFPPVAVTFVGGSGTAAGVTGLDAAETGPVPIALVAVTVNVYAVPLLRPLSATLSVLPPTVVVTPPGDAVTAYDVMALPPFDAGAVHVTVADALAAVA